MPSRFQIIADNVARIRQRMAVASERSGRSLDDVRLVAVTKSVAAADARAVVAAGCTDLGESRPQELWGKAAELSDLPIAWQFIGHLQRNKVDRTAPLLALLHSGDSERLLSAVNAAAAQRAEPLPVLLEVNISGDRAKHGFAPAELTTVLGQLPEWPHLLVQGLMGMSGLDSTADEARRQFAALRQLRDGLQSACPPGVALAELSMGMSDDFEQAIAEGATIVRIGSALFEGLA